MIADIRNSGIVKRVKKFLRDNHGGMVIPMGFLMAPVFLAVGVGVDVARVSREQASFQAAMDAATLAISADDRAATEGLSTTQLAARIEILKALAKKYVKANYTREEGSDAEIEVDVAVNGQRVRLEATHRFPTTLMRFVGVENMQLEFFAEVQKAMKPVEVVLVMDTTGSMSQSITAGAPLPPGITSASQIDTKIEGAKYAAQKFLNQLYVGTLAEKATSAYIRVALVPFSGAVRLNTAPGNDFNMDWIDTTGLNPLSRQNFNQGPATTPATWNNFTAWSQIKKTSTSFHTWNGCVETRRNGTGTNDFHINDTAPTNSNPDTLFPAYFMPDVSGTGTTAGTNNFGVNYIGGNSTSSVGSECRGLSFCDRATATSSINSSNFYRIQQENYNKYVNRVVGNESASTFGPWTQCALTPIVPMTYDRSKVEAGLLAMAPHGSTVIPEGLSWGLRAISPTAPLTQVEGFGTNAATTIASFDNVRWNKVVLLMTDGNNDVGPGSFSTNSSWYTSYGLAGEAVANNRYGTTSSSGVEDNLNAYTLAACSKIKALNNPARGNVTLYVSSFGNGVSNDTKNMLSACATTPGHYMHAGSSADLIAAFDHFGSDTLNKMVYVSK
jgi:Flp pilus assembly protein TadG